MSKKSSIEVAIRIRPMRTELNESKVVWEVNSTSLRERANPDCHFTFERVYNSNSTTKDMYELSVRDNIVKNVALGYNGTVFAYGQTGSGKSFTMLGTNDPNNEGIVAMAVRDLFLALDKERQNNKQVDIQVYLTILEIYNEQLRDLLVPPGGVAAALAIRENEHGVYVHNAARRLVKNAKECLYVMQQEAESRRVSAATAMNERSSRSHCLIRVHVEKTFTFDAESDDDDSEGEDASPAGDALKKKIVSSLNLVDLAGSERVAKTGATGQRMVEGGHINKSLTILTTVINRLTETSKSGTTGYIPYRDSKLTHLLKTAIGGNSFTTVFCCMTPAEQHVDESRSTLQFAARAKTIKNEVSMNEIADSKTKIRELEADIKRRKSLMVAMQLYLWSKEIKIKMLTDGSGGGGAGFDGKGSAGKGGSSSSAAGGGGPSSPLRAVQAAADEQLCQLQLIVEQLEQRNEALQKDLRDAKAKAGAGGYVDPMSGMVADDPEKRQLRQRCNELQRNVEDLTEEKNDVQEALDELDELCRELESENTQVSGELNELQQKYRAQEAQLQSAKGLEQSLKNQVEQLQGQLRGEERRLLEQARGDELLESLTKLHVEHQSLQFEHNTLMDMYTREEVDREAAKTALKERLAEVENEKDDLRATNQLQNSYLWRLLSVAALVTRGKTIDPDETRSAVRESQVESAVQSLTAFVSSRMNRPPGVVTEESIKTPATAQGARATLFGNQDDDDDDFDIPLDRAAKQSQQRSAANNNNNSNNSAATAATVNSGSAMSTSTGSGGDVSSLEKRVKDLEQQLVAKDAQRDIIIDTKLKRIQDLVLRLHTTNQKLTQELHAATEQNEKLFEIVKKDPRFANKAAKGGLQPFVEADALARANYAPVPQKPFGHN